MTFDELCDKDHIINKDNKIYCARTSLYLGDLLNNGNYVIDSSALRFLDLGDKIPVPSQPENFWGTEGQYRQWNSNDMLNKPLSY